MLAGKAAALRGSVVRMSALTADKPTEAGARQPQRYTADFQWFRRNSSHGAACACTDLAALPAASFACPYASAAASFACP